MDHGIVEGSGIATILALAKDNHLPVGLRRCGLDFRADGVHIWQSIGASDDEISLKRRSRQTSV